MTDIQAERPLRIVFLDYVLDLDEPGRSGLSDMVWDMASELVDLGHDVHVIGPYQAHLAPDPRIEVHSIRVPPFGYRWHLGYLWISQRLARQAMKLKPDIVHAPEYISIATFVTLYPNHGAQAVVTVPGNVYHRLSIPNGFVTTPLGAALLKWAAQQAARSGPTIIAISEEMKRWWEWTGSPAYKTPLIPLGANPQRFGYVPDSRVKLDIPADVLHLLFVGRFSHEKGLLPLIEALRVHRDRLKGNLRLTLVGKGILEQELRRRLAEYDLDGVTTIVPWVHPDELSRWYSAADALVLPSFTEGFSRVICEAMLCGTPVIGSRIAGTEDHVQDDVNGFLFPRGDVSALADILAMILDDPERLRSLRSSTCSYGQQHLAWPGIVRRIVEEVYRPIARDLRSG